MAIQDDFSVAANGDIRYTGTTANYTVIQLHRWLGDLMDDAQSAGNDLLDITNATAAERSTDNIITLKAPYNIDDLASRHLYDGTIIQANGDTIYDGILVLAPTGTYLSLQQNGKLVTPNFWTNGLNADAANGISHRFMIKVRTGAADIDGRRLIGQTREFGSTYGEFKINGTSRGNNVLAINTANDLNNSTIASTVAGWNTISNTEGYRSLDVDNNTVSEPYYSEWNRSTFTINQLFERAKWLSARATVESTGTDTGTSYSIGDASTIKQGQSFANGAKEKYLSRVHVRLKKTGAPTGNLTAVLYAHSGTFGTSSIATGAALATSVNIDVSKLTTSYQEIEIGFDTQYEMAASTNYVISFEYSSGDGSNYVQIEGAASGTHAGNRASYIGSWSASAGSDLNFSAYTNPKLYGLNGEIFRGITHQITIDTPTGTFSAVERVSWSGGTGQMLAIDSVTAGTKMWIQLLTGVAPTDNQMITGATSSATCLVNVTVTERTLSQPFIGVSTGSALIGGYGIGVETADLSANDKLTDLNTSLRIPPNVVTFTVSGLVASEDRVLVGPESGGALQTNQFSLSGALSSAAVTAVVVNTAIPTDTPATGTIRIKLTSGIYRRVPYTSYTGSTFTIASTDFSSDTAPNTTDVYISYIDKLAASSSESFSGVYLADRSLFIRVRDGGGTPIKTFESTGTLGSAGGSATAIRTSDT